MKVDDVLIKSSLIPLDGSSHISDQVGGAAVLVPFVMNKGQWCLLLTKRAINMRHHGGEIAFPGGMWEKGDQFPVDTALRESEEEVALLPHQVNVLGKLPAMPTRNGMMVTSVVGVVSGELSLKASPDEVESILYVPLENFHPENRIRTDVFSTASRWAPAYDYSGEIIWGFTASVIKMLLMRCFDVPFTREHPAPEKIW